VDSELSGKGTTVHPYRLAPKLGGYVLAGHSFDQPEFHFRWSCEKKAAAAFKIGFTFLSSAFSRLSARSSGSIAPVSSEARCENCPVNVGLCEIVAIDHASNGLFDIHWISLN